jgi:nicotinamide phosphoribosyltransferase
MAADGAAGGPPPAAAAAAAAASAPLPPLLSGWLPIPVLTDSYKASHFLQYPPAERMAAYGEFRRGYAGDTADTRLVFWGMRYILETHVARRWTREDVARADAFFGGHLAPAHGPFPYPRDLFLRFIEENGGYMPVTLAALPDGSAVHARVPVFQITADAPYAALVTYLETLLVQAWYPSTVATLSRRARDAIGAAFEASVEGGGASPLLASRLHDFGFRGASCLEASVLGGVAHLLSFDGSDTMSACYYAQYALNGGRPVGMSIPATEHSVMTAWPTERAAIANMIAQFGCGVFATVMDSYDYKRALREVVPAVAAEHVAAGGFWVLRPDSGDPVDAVLAGLRAAEAAFGAETNAKGFRAPRGVGVIFGDGIGPAAIGRVLEAVLAAGFAADAVAFGMGGGLLQKVDRDTMRWVLIVLMFGNILRILESPNLATDHPISPTTSLAPPQLRGQAEPHHSPRRRVRAARRRGHDEGARRRRAQGLAAGPARGQARRRRADGFPRGGRRARGQPAEGHLRPRAGGGPGMGELRRDARAARGRVGGATAGGRRGRASAARAAGRGRRAPARARRRVGRVNL